MNKVLTSDANGLATWQIVPASTNNWSTTGNAGTSSSTNFLGTLDTQDLVMKTNNTERLRVYSGVTSDNLIANITGGDIQVNGITL